MVLAASCATSHPPGSTTPEADPRLRAVSVNGVQLHYTMHGRGTPIVFVHGGLADYREWIPTIEKLPTDYLAITYSRRYNFPNQNALVPDHSAVVEAEDLASLLRSLKVAPAHVVGVSYGAYTALLLALKHPELVRTVTLAEPPLMSWLSDLPGGRAAREQFMSELWDPAGAAFRAGDNERALRVTVDYFVGSPGAYDHIPPHFRTTLQGNIREWKALTTSREPFPPVTRAEVGLLTVPALIITGAKTYKIGQLIDPELARIIPSAEHIDIPDSTHDMCSEKPVACAEAINSFVSKAGGLTSR